jgi:hypothetical protein
MQRQMLRPSSYPSCAWTRITLNSSLRAKYDEASPRLVFNARWQDFDDVNDVGRRGE